MDFAKQISPENKVANHRYGAIYNIENEDGTIQSVFEYCIPFRKEVDEELVYRYGLNAKERDIYYQNLASAVQNQFDTCSFLKQQNIRSILTFSQVQKVRDGDITKIYLATEKVVPITETLLADKITTLSALEIILRLTVVIRDLNNLNPPLCHGGLDIEEVYINEDNLFLLGGFFYSGIQGEKKPPFLCDCPNLIKISDAGSSPSTMDVKTLAGIAWSIFAGLAPGTPPPPGPLVFPQYATEDIAQAIALGWSGTADIAMFRRKLSDCRARIKNGTNPNKEIPLMKKYTSTFAVVKTYANVGNTSDDLPPEQASSDRKKRSRTKRRNTNDNEGKAEEG